MILSYTITNATGESLVLELARPELSGLVVRNATGFGAPKAILNFTDHAVGDGASFNSARTDKRNLVFYLQMYSGTVIPDLGIRNWQEQIEILRRLTYKYFPIKQNVRVTVQTSRRTCYTDGRVESNAPNIFSEEEDTQISIVCPDSYLYSTAYSGGRLSAVRSMFEFPFSNESLTTKEIIMSEIEIPPKINLVYDGEVPVGVTMRIHILGTTSGITIYNLTTGQSMPISSQKITDIMGSDLQVGDDIFITTIPRQKSATLMRDGKFYNIINALGKNIQWFQLNPGSNVFSASADVGITRFFVDFSWQAAFQGV